MNPGLKSWREKAPTKKAALHALLSDGLWHEQHEMAAVAGYRYGAALFCLHQEDGAIHYTKEHHAKDGTRVRYRLTNAAGCDVCLENKERPSETIARLMVENHALRARIAELEALHG